MAYFAFTIERENCCLLYAIVSGSHCYSAHRLALLGEQISSRNESPRAKDGNKTPIEQLSVATRVVGKPLEKPELGIRSKQNFFLAA